MDNQIIYSQEDYGFNSKYTAINNSFIKEMRYNKLMNANDWLIFSMLLSYRKDYNVYVYEGYLSSICTECGLKRNTFDRSIKRLKNLELISVIKKAHNNTEKTIVEFLNIHLYVHTPGRDVHTDFINYMNRINASDIENKKIKNNKKKNEPEPIVNIVTIEELPIKKEEPAVSFNIIKDKSKINLAEDESYELFEEYIKVKGFSTMTDGLNYIRRILSNTKETFNDHCKRIIEVNKQTNDEIILSLIK